MTYGKELAEIAKKAGCKTAEDAADFLSAFGVEDDAHVWVVHNHGDYPLFDDDTQIEVMLLNGSKEVGLVDDFIWSKCGAGTIIKYRVV